MARPHPVVGVTAELAYGGRRSADQADIAIHPEHEQEVLVAIVQGLDAGAKALALRGRGLGQDRGVGAHDGVALRLAHGRVISLQYCGGDIIHPLEETHGQAGIGKLLSAVHRPETVLEVVVLDARMPLDVAVAAVVVGEQQALVRDELSGTTGSEKNDGILQGSLVDTVNVLGGKLETFGLHIGDTLRNKSRQPHAFIGLKRLNGSEKNQQEEKMSFHMVIFSFDSQN